MEVIKKHFHLLILILLFLMILPISYYFIYTLPQYQKERLELQKEKQYTEKNTQNNEEQRKEQRATNLNDCFKKAEWVYNKTQEFLFQKAEELDCKNNLACLTVNINVREENKKDLANEKNECFKLYGN